MKKFKVGDRVRVLLPGYVGYEYEICDVKMHGGRCGYKLKKDDGFVIGAVWWEDELELIKPKNFTKSDLKDGMVVEYRNGDRRIVLAKQFMAPMDILHMPFSSYTDDLKEHNGDSEYDIVKVYTSKGWNMEYYTKDHHLTLIWEREEKKNAHKYKVGDKIKFRDDLATGKFRISVFKEMATLAGKIVTVKALTGKQNPGYFVTDEWGYIYTEDMFEGLVDYEEMTVEEIEKQLGYRVKIVGEV